MLNRSNSLREFSDFRVDVQNKFLWHKDDPVELPLKALELLCVLTEKRGEVVSKEEIWREVWNDAFIEETNLTHNIYLLRKAFRKYGENALIQTVPRRGYRFAAEVRAVGQGDIVLERRSVTRTLIEEVSDASETDASPLSGGRSRRTFAALVTALCLLALIGGFAAWRIGSPENPQTIKSLAVLPFTTIDARSGDELEGIGLADILITRLSNVNGVSVRPTSSVMNMNGSDVMADAKKLNVDAVILGSIYRTADKVRITARLVRTDDGFVLWSGEFEKLKADELRIQNEIALQIVNAFALNLSGDEKAALAKRYTESPDAYQLYVRGRFEWNKRNWPDMIEAQRLFRTAIAEDPNFALAHVGLADSLAMDRHTQAEALNAAQKALEIDPKLAEAHASIGFIQTFHQWNWSEAESSFKRSIELNDGYATAHHWYAELLAIRGRNDESLAEMHRALELEPLSHSFLADLGQKYYFAGDYAQAEAYCQKALEIYPDFNFAYWHLKEIFLRQEEYGKALEADYRGRQSNFLADTPASEKKLIEQAFLNRKRILAEVGGREMLKHSVSAEIASPDSAWSKALILALLDEKEKALDNLEIALAERTFGMIFVKANPIFENLRSEPRYQEILRKMDLAH